MFEATEELLTLLQSQYDNKQFICENKLCFYAALQGELFIRDQWIGKKNAELAAAEASGDAKNVFEITIMLGAVKNMFAAWEQWRVENDIFPHMFEGDFE